jgi:CHAT domain-containing protein/Tfp pilus assembly protein PilF
MGLQVIPCLITQFPLSVYRGRENAELLPRHNRSGRLGQGNFRLRVFISTSLLFLAGLSVQAMAEPFSRPGQVSSARQNSKDASPLQQGEVIERELSGGETHNYHLTLAPGQYLRLAVDQKGIDVLVALFGPDGKALGEFDSPNGSRGPESVLILTESSGVYRVEVRSLEKNADAGRYEIKILEMRTATEKDKKYVAAQKADAEGVQLRLNRSAPSLRKSIEKFEEAISLWRAIGDEKGETVSVIGIGLSYDDLGEKQKALEYYNKALPLCRATGDRMAEALAFNNVGAVYHSLGENQKALEYYGQALSLRKVLGDEYGQAETLNNLGVVYYYTGENQKALDHYGQALALFQAIGYKLGQANMLNGIGLVYNALGENQKALGYYEQAMTLWRAVGDRRGEGLTLNNIGLAYDSMAEYQKALDYYRQGLVLREAIEDRGSQANSLGNIGAVYRALGETQKALDHYKKALPLHRAVSDRRGEALTLNNIGAVYKDLGDYQNALGYYSQSLPLREAVGDRGGQANTLTNIGVVNYALGDRQKALDYYNQALEISRAIGDSRSQGNALGNMARVYATSGDRQKALDYYNQALQISRSVEDRRGEAYTLSSMGDVYTSLRERQKALDHYSRALELCRAIGDPSNESSTLYGMALIERDSDNLVTSRSYIESCLEKVESVRSKISSHELRVSYLASVQKYYQFYIDLLMRLYRLRPSQELSAAALQASERARARSLIEMLTESRANIRRGVDATLLERERSLQQLLSAKVELQTKLLTKKHTEAQAASMAKEVEAIMAEYHDVEASIRATSPGYAALTQPQPLSLKQIQQEVLGADTSLLEYATGDERSYLWVVTKDSIKAYDLPKRSEIEAAARRFYELIVEPNRRYRSNGNKRVVHPPGVAGEDRELQEVAVTMSRMLLGPAAAEIGKNRLVIVPDGVLHYVPFAALPDPNSGERRPLIASHEIVTLPSASTMAVLRREMAGREPLGNTIAVIADPVFDSHDLRVKESVSSTQSQDYSEARGLLTIVEKAAIEAGLLSEGMSIPRLPGTRREAQRILSFAPEARQMKALDFAANRKLATGELLSHYRFVHFATHGFLNAAHPEFSGIILSMVDGQGNPQNGFLLAPEVYNMKLPADMVVLSACQTGLGKQVKGEGLVGLTRGLMYAGAARVVVSLWNVDDEATSEMMGRFYEGILKKGMRPAAALKSAQETMWKQKKWRAPYYWAAFILQGEWQ